MIISRILGRNAGAIRKCLPFLMLFTGKSCRAFGLVRSRCCDCTLLAHVVLTLRRIAILRQYPSSSNVNSETPLRLCLALRNKVIIEPWIMFGVESLFNLKAFARAEPQWIDCLNRVSV